MRAKDPADAKAPLARAVALEPTNTHVRFTLGQLLRMREDLAAALRTCAR